MKSGAFAAIVLVLMFVLVLMLNLISAHVHAASQLNPEFDPHFEEAGRLNNVDPLLLKAIAMGDNSGRVNQPHPGAIGLMSDLPVMRHYRRWGKMGEGSDI